VKVKCGKAGGKMWSEDKTIRSKGEENQNFISKKSDGGESHMRKRGERKQSRKSEKR
jgi:hypothetical protein